ncbi:von Willebrand factor A domain-containing protein 3B isoform X2 [Dermochelys coriacea]|uniref:von Willebrand factor A domain-containing protein 3B isoform X2 n=1 Tax=Dermochelys coriacea TaxID=27794 RepID=UPI001CA9E4FE|nr:von Willebrand factor A domain-containing protein 3B isoform X2 [Dermochelys coriacea]XP_043347299.1 von Willebrand factor A domain-containing protein 3B isoform X2 [Dermochelys coriacea]
MIGNLCKRVAWSDQVTLDMKHKREQEKSDSDIAHKGKSKEKERRLKSTLWDLDVQSLISSSQWLQCHGLKRNKLSLSQILSQIGFQHREDYVSTLGKFVASRYADGLFPQYLRAQDGRVYNLTAKKELILHFVDCLTGAIELYKQRMEWVTSESRQIFGVILESCITIVLDFGTVCRTEFDLCRDALSMVLSQQVVQLAKFNLIRTARDLVKWQQKVVPVTEYSVESAVKWLWKLDHMPEISHTSSTEALLEAISDETVEAVYYFTVGDFPKDMTQLLLQKVSNSPYPIHIVSFNAKEEETILFLKEMSQLTSGRFHAFAERTDHIDIIGPIPKSEEDGESLATQNSRKLKGKVPLVAGVREDVFMIWKESEEARNALIQLQNILSESHQPISGKATTTDLPVPEPNSEDYISSKEWLQKNGLKAQKLTLYEALADCTFRHADGVVDIKAKPEDESLQTDAETNKKIIHAKYCDKFVHTYWKDGSVVHVYVSTEKYRQYEERMKNALGLMERRVKWLQRGSRGLFGNVLEDHIYILIDTSQSMRDKLPLVKEKILQLIQEQLRHKSRFNFVKFDAQAVAWQEKLVEVNEENLQDAWLWIKELEPPKTILTQILLRHKVPIHTISFNCDDTEANKFLHELSTETGGRFHYYNIYVTDPEAPEPIVSEDVYLLKREIEQGERDLEKVQTFHTECLMMNWYNGEKDCENKHHKQTLTASSVTTHIQDLNTSPTSRPYCASDEPLLTSHQRTVDVWQTRCDSPVRRKSALYAEQTKTSLLRTLGHQVRSCEERPDERISPERKGCLLRNSLKSATIFKELNTQKVAKRTSKDSLDTSSVHWLKTHGLIARRLTIMDALAPTAVPHSTKYIPVLDKHVVSKVFDEVLPLAHVSNDKKRITLINPQAVNLDAYKEKLEQAIKSYERRLNLIIWRALSQEERDKFEQEEPVSYMEHKEALLQALENLGWPVSYDDVTLLEDEILAGLTYIQQASDLQEAAKKEIQRTSASYINHSKMKLTEENVKAQSKKRHKGKVYETLKGQKVIARSDITGFYFPGTVIKSISSSEALVDFSHGETQIVPIKFIIPVGGAMPCPSLQVGDYVFARTGIHTGNDYYMPAVVIATPKRVDTDDKLYTVLRYNNRKKHCIRSGLIKISQTKYACSCRYIRMAHMVDCLLPNVQAEKSIQNSSPEEEKEKGKKLKEDGGKKKKKGKVESKTHPREKTSDSDGLLFTSRKEVKNKEKNSLPSDKEETEGKEVRNKLFDSSYKIIKIRDGSDLLGHLVHSPATTERSLQYIFWRFVQPSFKCCNVPPFSLGDYSTN